MKIKKVELNHELTPIEQIELLLELLNAMPFGKDKWILASYDEQPEVTVYDPRTHDPYINIKVGTREIEIEINPRLPESREIEDCLVAKIEQYLGI